MPTARRTSAKRAEAPSTDEPADDTNTSQAESEAGPGVEACSNCDAPATVVTDGLSADQIGFCDRHVPVNLVQ